MKKMFRKITNISVAAVMLIGILFTPQAFAKTASAASSAIDDLVDSVEELRTGTTYDTATELDSTTEVDNFFEELAGFTDEATDEVKAVNRPISQTDFTTVEESYDDFKSEVTKTLRAIDTLITNDTIQTHFNTAKRDFQNEDELDDLETAFTNLQNSLTGGTTTGSTSSATVNNAVEDIDQAADDVKDLRSTTDTLTTQTQLDTFFTDLTGFADDVVTALRRITGSLSSTDFDNIDSSVSDFNDQVDSRFTKLTQRTGSGSDISSLRSSYTTQKGDYRDEEKNDINTQMERIRRLAFGTSAGSSLISSAVSDIEDLEDEINDLIETDSAGVNTVTELEDYFAEIVDRVNDIETALERITGAVTQSDYDDLADAVDSFQDVVTDARNEVRTNSAAETFTDAYDSEKDDLDDEIDNMEEALAAIEERISTLNSTGGTTTFFDVLSSSEFSRYITALASRSIINGYSDRSFRPKNNVTRAEFLKMAIKAANKNTTTYENVASTFSDVPMSHSLRPYINYASAQQIVTGQTVGSARVFYPERPISRAEAMIILLRINSIPASNVTTSRFSDVRDPEQIRYIETAFGRGIINGYSATIFGPNDFLTREQAAKIVAKMNGLAS